MYTHARQFPHLAGMSDEEIRNHAQRSIARRPHLGRILRLRNVAVLVLMGLAALLLARLSRLSFGIILMLVGGVSTAVLLSWNLIWVNTVLYRITMEDSSDGRKE